MSLKEEIETLKEWNKKNTEELYRMKEKEKETINKEELTKEIEDNITAKFITEIATNADNAEPTN